MRGSDWNRGNELTLSNKPLADLLESDLEALVENQVPESTTLENKRDLPGSSQMRVPRRRRKADPKIAFLSGAEK